MKNTSENYLIIGDDVYLKKFETDKIVSNVLSGKEPDLNYSAHSPEDLDNIMDSLGTLPFVAEKRVVLVRDAHELSESSCASLINYLKNPSPTSVLILSAENSFENKKAVQGMAEYVEIIRADKLAPVAARRKIIAFFEKEKADVSPEAVDLLIDLKGTDAFGLKTELEKLAAFAGGERVEAKHVEELVGRSVTEEVFKLIDAINEKKPEWVFRILQDLYDQKKDASEIIGYLAWYVRRMQDIGFFSEKGLGVDELSRKIGYSPQYTRRLLGQAKNYNAERVKKWLFLIYNADRDIKTGRREARLAVETLLVMLLDAGTE